MGKECFKVFKNLPMTEEKRKDPTTILKKLTEEFEGKNNIIYKIYAFNSCVKNWYVRRTQSVVLLVL